MARNLAEKGSLSSPLIIFNRTAKRAYELHSQVSNTTVVESIDVAASKADIIFISLSDDSTVTGAVDTILKSGSVSGKLIVDCSTIHPDTTAAISKSVTDAGAHFVACPVFGAPAMADAGQLICVAAGPSSDVDKIKPYCEGVIGRAIIDFSGQEPCKATLLKLIGNTFILNMVETLSEGHVVAEKTGLGVEELHKFIAIMFPGPSTSYSSRFMSGDYYNRDEPLFSVDLARKDARHAQALAQKAGVTMKNVQLADEYLKVVQEEMGSKGDIAGIYGAKRMEAGLSFRNKVLSILHEN